MIFIEEYILIGFAIFGTGVVVGTAIGIILGIWIGKYEKSG